ncbi:MAG: CotH kinase family protein, partial [Verrucomicrobiota bacterium]
PLPMVDDGTGGDLVAGDAAFSVLLGPSFQTHRRLIRYRIIARDFLGDSVQVPYADDPQPNFAYFCYGQMPDWTGSARPGVLPMVTYSNQVLETLPVCHMITKQIDHLDAMHNPYRYGEAEQILPPGGSYGGSGYLWNGTIVYDGKVYDHVRYRARGGVWRYAMGKNMWKIDFNTGHWLETRDDYGKKRKIKADKLNLGALIQQGNFQQRGEQGIFEGVGFKLHNLAGNAAPNTQFIHYRIVDKADEGGPDQYSTDFRGLYLAVEQLDGRFLDEHGLSDGNFYKMEGGTGTLNNQGATQPSDRSDLDTFQATYQGPPPSEHWWRDNLDLDNFYTFRAIAMAIHDYDIHNNKNYFYYHNPDDDRWQVINWDLDLCWTTTYNGGGGNGPLNRHMLYAPNYDPFIIEYNNRVREIVDLLFNSEQVDMAIEEVCQFVYTPGQPSFVDADRAMWDYNPLMVSPYINNSKSGHDRYYEA